MKNLFRKITPVTEADAIAFLEAKARSIGREGFLWPSVELKVVIRRDGTRSPTFYAFLHPNPNSCLMGQSEESFDNAISKLEAEVLK